MTLLQEIAAERKKVRAQVIAYSDWPIVMAQGWEIRKQTIDGDVATIYEGEGYVSKAVIDQCIVDAGDRPVWFECRYDMWESVKGVEDGDYEIGDHCDVYLANYHNWKN